METFELTGKSLHGKNRIREHGRIWTVIDTPPPPFPLKEDSMLLRSPDGDWRWVQRQNDRNFSVKLLENA